jgi:hypothetical protein
MRPTIATLLPATCSMECLRGDHAGSRMSFFVPHAPALAKPDEVTPSALTHLHSLPRPSPSLQRHSRLYPPWPSRSSFAAFAFPPPLASLRQASASTISASPPSLSHMCSLWPNPPSETSPSLLAIAVHGGAATAHLPVICDHLQAHAAL